MTHHITVRNTQQLNELNERVINNPKCYTDNTCNGTLQREKAQEVTRQIRRTRHNKTKRRQHIQTVHVNTNENDTRSMGSKNGTHSFVNVTLRDVDLKTYLHL